ncbi:MAG: DHH family phosphoesterase [Lachnospiraceae bacterium]|nr:DHH family phosphoesterase [Lachnospiraceae bacterium]
MSRNKNRLKLKGRLKRYVQMAIYLGILLAAVNILIYLIDLTAGIVLSVYVAIYFVTVLFLNRYNRPAFIRELVSFATHYGQVQKVLLKELEVPYAILDDEGHLVWMNDLFMKVTGKSSSYHKSITSIFPSITKEKLPGDKEEYSETDLVYEEESYQIKMRRLTLRDMVNNSDIVESDNYEGYLIAVYLFDTTALKLALQEVDDQSLAVGMIYLDNFDEALNGVEEVRRSLLVALIDRRVNQYISNYDGICKKLEKDKYMIILRKKAMQMVTENKFDILDVVKTVNLGNDMAVTISIGVGLDGLSYAQNYEFARNAIDLALGRGGDQAVVKTPGNIVYYGGKSQQVEKNTKVKARVKAQALQEIISSKEQVLIMGHRLPDADSFSSALGIYKIARSLDRKAYIVLNEVTSAIKPMVDLFTENDDYPKDMIINNLAAIEMADSNTVLVVVDVNKPSITECPDLLRLCKSIVVLDHHRQGTESIENATLSYVEAYASSACEMVSEILQYIDVPIRITAEEADCMYSGIMIDTNNFMSKTGVRTFEAAAYLRRSGADMTRIRKMFREDANEYKAKADAVSQAEIYRGAFAISTCSAEDLESPTVIGAQAANELLNIKGVKASFVLTDYQNQINISARSIDEVNVQLIMEQMGGGGHLSAAGTQLSNVSIEEGIGELKATLDRMIEAGDLKI